MLELISTFYIKDGEQQQFQDNLEANKKKIDAIMPKGVTYDGIYIHGFGTFYKYECRFILENISLTADLQKVMKDDTFKKSIMSYIDTKRPIEMTTVKKLI